MNTISTLSTADLTKAWHIEKRAHAFPWSEQTLASNQGERYRNYQLSVDGEMAAFAITQVVLDEATLFNIAVDPAYQRRGLGRALLEHVIDEVEKLGVVTLWLEVRASNVAAIALYEGRILQKYPPKATGSVCELQYSAAPSRKYRTLRLHENTIQWGTALQDSPIPFQRALTEAPAPFHLKDPL